MPAGLFLKRKENLTTKQDVKLAELLKYNLKSIRAYLLKQSFQMFWEYQSATWAGKFLDKWCTRTMRSKFEPMKKIAKTLRKHRSLILNWYKAKGAISQAAVESLNNKLKLTIRKSYGFRTRSCRSGWKSPPSISTFYGAMPVLRGGPLF